MKKLILSLAFLLCWSVNANAQSLPPNVDLKDIVQHGSGQARHEAQALIEQIRQAPDRFGLPAGVTYSELSLSAIGQNLVSTAEVQNQTEDGFDLFLVYNFEQRVWLNRMKVDRYHQVRSLKSFDLTKNPPSAQIDILNRQLILREEKSGFIKIEPVSLGALVLDQPTNSVSRTRTLSKTFSRAYLSKSQSDVSRTKPEYYSGRPFLRVMDQNQSEHGGFTPFGLHYQISDVLLRGFISNGCFRLRDNDLYELASLVFLSKKNGVPFTVVDYTEGGNRHPYPSINSWFNTPRMTVDAHGRTVFETEEHGLYVFDRVDQRPADLLRQNY